ncbi:MAG TPA: pyridoxamine 5'-phosphate oxidase family protein, partial [Candidatus Limnocylindria bacterium]|nr:pyridoxamine 5'-phosphate oxidase family protein [Candidatus Limnocylindria bacterium]
LATVDKDGRPHLMPFIGIWIDDAIYFVSSEETQKGRNLIGDPRCVISTSNTEAPSMDLIVEAEARKVEDAARLKEVVGVFTSKLKWPLEIQDGAVIGPNAPTAGPPPYAVFEAKPIVVFGLPGMAGMEQTDPDDRFTPTRWQF